jgi:hypothetical protein
MTAHDTPHSTPIGTDGLTFLRLILPETGYLVLHVKRSNGRRWQQAFERVEDLIEALLRFDRQGHTVYHACGGFINGSIKEGLRSQANCGWLRAFWLDIDTQITHPNTAKYKDKVEAYFALVAFCKQARLPPPILVDSGGGLQCWWPLDQDVDPGTWQRYARAIGAACKRYGLDADPSRTADHSSVLRTPGTHHHKLGCLVECGSAAGPYSLSAFEHLKQYADGGSKKRGKGKRRAVAGKDGAIEYVYDPRPPAPASLKRSGQSPIAAVRANIYDPSDPAKVVHTCRQLSAFAQDPGAYSEPFHYCAAGVLGHCVNGAAFYLSLLDNEWQATGEAKLDQWMSGGWGPATCQRIANLNPGGCDGCPHRGKITSPIQLGTQAHGRSATAKRWWHIRQRRIYAGPGRRY